MTGAPAKQSGGCGMVLLILLVVFFCFSTLGKCSPGSSSSSTSSNYAGPSAPAKSFSNSGSSSSSSQSSNSSSSSSETSWFSGGTLHRSIVREWRDASYRNRLATAADFIAATQNVDYGNLQKFKSMAVDLETCISTAVSGGDVDRSLVTSVSAMCTASLFP